MTAKAEIRLSDRQFAAISKALSDENRFAMLRRIAGAAEAPTCLCVREWLGLAAATVSHHLKELSDAGLVHVEREGRFARISLQRDVLKAYVKRLGSL